MNGHLSCILKSDGLLDPGYRFVPSLLRNIYVIIYSLNLAAISSKPDIIIFKSHYYTSILCRGYSK